MKRRRIVVTGLGVISSVGIGWREFWKAILTSHSGISEVTTFDTTKFPSHRGGEVKEFNPEQFITSLLLKRCNRASQFAIASAKLALIDAHLDTHLLQRFSNRVGVVIGTTMAEAQAIEAIDSIWINQGAEKIHPRLPSQYPSNVIGAHLAAELGCRGPNVVITTACAAGNYALAYAFDLLRLGRADVMIAGGSDAFSRIAFMGFNRLLAVAPDRCQPFDRNRKGTMVGEGAGVLVLERLEDARARRATIYAEILGYGLSCDANHMTIPALEGVKCVMNRALDNSGLKKSDVHYISAHGTGTSVNDRTECAAIRAIFGSYADHLPISSIKSMIGHTMGAASALEAITCVLAIHQQAVPPTINYETPDPECDIDCVPNISRSVRVKYALNNSFAFGGNNACLAFGVVDGEN